MELIHVHIFCLQVNGATSTSAALSSSDYTILQDNSQAHVVKISREVGEGAGPLFGFVVFALNGVLLSSDPTENLDAANGPIKNTTGPACLMTAQCVDDKTIAISLASPDLKLTRNPSDPTWCPNNDPVRPTRNGDVKEQLQYCAASSNQTVAVSLKNSSLTVSNIYVNGEAKSFLNMNDNIYVKVNGETIEFKTLHNGFTTEVHLTVPSQTMAQFLG